MSELTDIAPEETIHWGTRRLFLRRPNLETERAFARYLEGEALALIERHKGSMRGDTYDRQLKVWQQPTRYRYGGDEFNNAVYQTDDGFEEWLFLVLNQSHPDFERPAMRALFQEKKQELTDAYVRLMMPRPFPKSPPIPAAEPPSTPPNSSPSSKNGSPSTAASTSAASPVPSA